MSGTTVMKMYAWAFPGCDGHVIGKLRAVLARQKRCVDRDARKL